MNFPLQDAPDEVWIDGGPVDIEKVRDIMNEAVRSDAMSVIAIQPQDGDIPDYSTTNGTLTFYADTIINHGARGYVLGSDQTVDLRANATTADKIYFDTSAEGFVVRDWNATLTAEESRSFILFGVSRAPDDNNEFAAPNLSISCDYTIDGVDPRDISGESIGIIAPQNGNIPDLDTVAGTLTFFSDTIMLWRGKNFVIDTDQVLDLGAEPTTAEKIYFNIATEEFATKAFDDTLSLAERRTLVMVAGVRAPDVFNPSAEYNLSIACPYSTDGARGDTPSSSVTDYDDLVRGVAHRGFSATAPENTLPSYILAKRKGFVFVEADLRLTSDNQWVLIHDEDVDRTSDGSGDIDLLTLAQARNFDFSNGKTGFTDTPIPTAAEFFALCKRLSLTAIVELKVDPAQARVDDLIALAEATGMADNVWYNSFDITVMDKVLSADPTAKIGHGVATINAGVISGLTSRKTSVNEVFLIPQFSNLTTTTAGLAHAEDIEMYCWTVNTATDVPLAANLGVRGVMTDMLLVNEVLMLADGASSSIIEASDLIGDGFPSPVEDMFPSRESAIAADIDSDVNSILIAPLEGYPLRYTRDPAGTALSTNSSTVNWRPYGLVHPDHWLTNDPGVTDMTPAFQAWAAQSSAGDVLKLINGQTYLVTDTTVITNDNITIDRTGATIDASGLALSLVQNSPDAVFHVQGSQRLATTLVADAAEGATTITVADATSVEVGDPIWIESDAELWYTEGLSVVERQVHNRVKAISGTTVTLTWPLPMSFDATTHTPVVHFWNCVKNFRIIGGRSLGGGVRNDPENPGTYVSNGKGAADVYLEYVDGASVEVDYIEGFQGFGVRTEKTMDAHVFGGTIRGHTDEYVDPVTSSTEVVEGRNSGFYGVFFVDSYGGSFRDCTSHRTRHMQDAASSANFLISNLHAYRNHRPPFGSHSGADRFTFESCFCDDGSGGVEWRGHSMTLAGCTLSAREGNAAALYDTEGSAADLPKHYIITGNRFLGDRQGMKILSNIGTLKSVNNHYEAQKSAYYPVDISTLDLEFASFSNDTMVSVSAYCLYAQSVSSRTRSAISVNNCRLKGYSSAPARFFDTEVVQYLSNIVDAGDTITHDSTGVVDTSGNYGIGGQAA